MGSDSVNAQLTVTFAPSRLQKLSRLIFFLASVKISVVMRRLISVQQSDA